MGQEIKSVKSYPICLVFYQHMTGAAKVIPRQLFELAIQASFGNKVVARGNLSAIRKDVTAGLYGGHHERKLKHLENQKVSYFSV